MDEAPSAAELAAAEPRRAAILQHLRRAPDGLDVEELAGALGLHPNTIRWHLGHLTDAGLVGSRRAHRGRPGRPRLVFEARSTAREVGGGFRFLSAVLASALHKTATGAKLAEQAGNAWGGHLVEPPPPYTSLSHEIGIERIVALLDEHAFEPSVEGTTIVMSQCPFRELVDGYGDVVCALHRGLLAGALETLNAGVELDELVPFAVPGRCHARLRTTA